MSQPCAVTLRPTRLGAKPLYPAYFQDTVFLSFLAIEKPFDLGEKGQTNFAAIEAIIKAQNSSNMSESALLIHDIVGNLLLTDLGMITSESDFFLLGGNSLLFGKLSYFIHKESKRCWIIILLLVLRELQPSDILQQSS